MKSVRNRLYRSSVAVLMLVGSMAHAANIAWTNTAGGNWNVTNNWNPNQIPSTNDTAFITNAGTYTVTLNVGATVAGMFLGTSSGVTTQTFFISAQTFTLNGHVTGTSNGLFNFGSGALAGTAAVAGTLNVVGGTLGAGSSLTVSSSAVMNLLAGGGTFVISGPLTNNGTVNWLGGGLQVNNNNTAGEAGAIWNQAGAQWYIQYSGTLIAGYNIGDEIFNNAGLLCRTNVSGSINIQLYLNNIGGTVQAQIGTILLSGSCNLAGTFQAASGAAIAFTAGNYLWNGTAVFEGPGSVAITGGTVTVPSPITSPLLLGGGTLVNVSNLLGSAYLTNVNIKQAESILGTNILWAGTSVPSTASLTIGPGAVLNLVAGGANSIFSGPLTNNGTVNWLGGAIQVNNNNTVGEAGAIWNQAGARWYLQYNATLVAGYNTGYEIFNNAGLLCKTNVAGTTTIQMFLNNTGGAVQAQIGMIDFLGGCNLGGIFQAASGAAIDFTLGNFFWNGTAVFEGPGSVAITGGTVTIPSPITSPVTFSGVSLINVSNLLGSAYLTNVNITQAETVVGTNIVWAVASVPSTASLTVAASGVLNLVAEESGSFTLTGPLTNNGTVNWLGGAIQVNNNNTAGEAGAIWNQAGAKWFIQCAQTLDAGYNGGYEIFHNAGLLCKTNVAGTSTVQVYLNNAGGTVQAQIGTIDFLGGSDLAGTFQAASGAAIDFTLGNYLWTGTPVFEGPGSVAITGGKVTVPSPITSPLAVSGVTLINVSNLLGSAYLTNVNIIQAETVAGTNIVWAQTTLPSTASLTVAATGVLNLVANGSGSFTLTGPLTNNGTVNWLGGAIQVNNNNTTGEAGAIWNQAGAKWFIQCSGQTLDAGYNTGFEIFHNAGLLCKTNVAGTTIFQLVLSNNTGTVDAEIGTLNFTGSNALGAGGSMSFGLNSLSSFGVIALANTAALNGTINVHLNNGYVPVVSNAFTNLTYSAFTGGFTTTTLPPVAIWQTTKAATALSIKVLKLVPQFKWPDPTNIIYGAKINNVQLDATASSPTNLSGTLAGAFVYTPTNGTILHSGSNQTLSVTFTPTDLASNSTATTNVSITVLQAPLTLTATNQSKTYGQTDMFAGTEFTRSGLVNGDTVTSATLASAGDPPSAPVSGSPYAITITNAVGDAGLTNYLITYVPGNLTVNQAQLTVNANAESKTYGQGVVFGSGSTLFTNSVLSNSERIGTVTLAVTGNGGAGNAPIGHYTITPSAAIGGSGTEANYNITYVTSTLTVTAAPLAVTANAQLKNYGQTVAFGIGSALFTSALSNNETIGTVTLAVSGNGGASNAPVGQYGITPSAATGGSGTESNYIISYITNTLTVSAAPLTVTADAQTKTYGQTLTFGGGSALFTTSSLSNNETIGTVTLAVSGNGGASNAPAGIYAITPSAATGGSGTESNYTIAYVTNTLTVTLPALNFAASLPNLTLSWPTNAAAFVLNGTANLAPPVLWTPITSGITVNGQNYTFTVAANGTNQYQFFSLITP